MGGAPAGPTAIGGGNLPPGGPPVPGGGNPPPPNNGTPTIFYMPDENGQPDKSQPYEGVIINGETFYSDENGELQRVPDGAVVEAAIGDGQGGTGMWQKTPEGGTRFDPNKPWTPEEAAPMPEELVAPEEVEAAEGNFESIMDMYAPYIESQYAMIDAATEQQITAYREQMAARGMYNSDAAMTGEQQIRDDAEGRKDSLYQELVMNAYTTAMEYQYKYDQLGLQQDQLDETTRMNDATIASDEAKAVEQAKQWAAERQIDWYQLGQKDQEILLDKARIKIDQYNSTTSRINANNNGSGSSADETDAMNTMILGLAELATKGYGNGALLAKAQEYKAVYGMSDAAVRKVLTVVNNNRKNGVYGNPQ
jgi:hypothetical protein